MKLNIFLPLTKVDATQRTVTGVFTEEALDRSGEIMDYETSKPLFKQWSESLYSASGGKNYGNVREMHSTKAVGCFVEELVFDDLNKSISGTARIIDEDAWQKVLAGVFTGFSVGGSYIKKWTDSALGKRRYTAGPQEVSLVDLPCVYGATFGMIKVAGANPEQTKFAQDRYLPEGELPELLKVVNDPEPTPAPAEDPLVKAAAAVVASAVGGVVDVADLNAVEQVWLAKDKTPFAKKADAIRHNESLATAEAVNQAVAPAMDAVAKLAGLLDPKSAAGASDPAVGPVATPVAPAGAPLEKGLPAVGPIGPSGGPGTPLSQPTGGTPVPADGVLPTVIAANLQTLPNVEVIRKACQLPWQKVVVGDAGPNERLSKGMYDIGRVASLLCELDWLHDCITCDSAVDNPKSELPMQMQGIINQLCMFLRALVKEETDKLMEGVSDNPDDSDSVVLVLMAAAGLKAGQMHKNLSAAGENIANSKLLKVLELTNNKLGKAAGSYFDPSDMSMPPALRKVLAVNQGMQTQLSTLASTVNALSKKVEEVLAQPMPSQGLTKGAPAFFAVPKEADGRPGQGQAPQGAASMSDQEVVEAFSKRLAAMDPREQSMTLMKMSLANPVREVR